MTLKKTVIGLAVIGCLACASGLRAAPAPDKTLPDFVVRELTHLEETYRILDRTAAKTWPGWTNYRDFPFLLTYPNNLRVLVGHPNPPAPFEKLPGLKVEDKDVCADFSAVNTAAVAYPLMAGGGPLPFGTGADGKPLTTVMMTFMSTDILKKGGYGVIPMPFCVELQILCYIHELFHCFQSGHIQSERVGNLLFNPDASFALYSALEGEALRRAFLAESRDEALAWTRDFLAARLLKRRASLPEPSAKQESGDDLLEGTAVYSEFRTCEVLRDEGYQTALDLSKDAYYTGFKNVDKILAARLEQLKNAASEIYDVKGKCYDYGCFQALLLQKHFPGWQAVFAESPSTLDAELSKRLPVADADLPAHEKRFRELYDHGALQARVGEAIAKRDAAYRTLTGRRGMTYIINFKPIQAYESQLAAAAPQFALGLNHMYMEGLPAIRADQTEISPIAVPVEGSQLYYFKVVDTAPRPGEKPYAVTGKAAGGGVYENAVLTTPLFTLKTPRLRVEESQGRVRLSVLPVLLGEAER